MNKQYGTINHNGINLTLQQEAFAHDKEHYCAHAVSDKGEDYKVWWAITDFETENEDETCNWDEFWVEKV